MKHKRIGLLFVLMFSALNIVFSLYFSASALPGKAAPAVSGSSNFANFKKAFKFQGERLNSILSAPTIDVWYGLNQTFGHLGTPQGQINILGNVSDPHGISSLTYSLNGGPENPLSIGPDTRRLQNPGDFNVEIFDSNPLLVIGANQVVIRATDGLNNTVTTTVNINYERGNTWPQSYSIDWSAASSIQDAAQVVDGKWQLLPSGVRILEPGYDRLIAIGDITWEDYEVNVPITIHDNLVSKALIGFLLRWGGHTDQPVSGWQPKSGWVPFGSIGAYTWITDYIGDRLRISGNPNVILAEDFSGKQLTINTAYFFKIRVESLPGEGSLYALKVWKVGESEPADWDLIGQSSVDDPPNGSVLLLAHMVDATFGDVSVQPIPEDSTPPQIKNVVIKPGLTSAVVTWETDEATSGKVAYGPSTNYDYGYASDSKWGQTHSVLLNSLSSGHSYHLRIESNDTQANQRVDIDRSFATNSPSPTSDITSEDFNVCNLDDGTWTFVDPVGDASYGLSGTFTQDARLEITVPGGSDHDNWIDKYYSPRLMQAAGNADFEVEVKFDSALSEVNQNMGLLVEENEAGKDYLRFEFLNAGSGTDLSSTLFVNGFPKVYFDQTVAAANIAPLYLRLKRTGDNWNLSYSINGSTWTPAGAFAYPLNVSAVGVYAGNANRASSPPVLSAAGIDLFSTSVEQGISLQGTSSTLIAPSFTGLIDYFVLTSTPVIPEDGDRNNLAITVVPAGGGTVEVEPDKSTYSCGELVNLTANPSPGWNFASWSGDLSGSITPVELKMYGERQIISSFSQEQFTLTVDISGGGTVLRDPDQIAYDDGQIVQLQAIPQPGWTFSGWSGDLSGDANPIIVLMGADRNINATFSPILYPLQVNISGAGSVTREPDQQSYIYGDLVRLTAKADPGWRFNSWSGDLSAIYNPIMVTMDGGKVITAHFIQFDLGEYYFPLFMNEH